MITSGAVMNIRWLSHALVAALLSGSGCVETQQEDTEGCSSDCSWSAEEVAEFFAPDPAVNDWFGYSVSISGDTAVVGAYPG